MRKLFVYAAAIGIAGGMALSAMAADAYIDTDGSQVVVLDYYVKPNTKIVADYAFLAVTPTQQRVFGASGREAGLSCALYISDGGAYYAFSFKDGNLDGVSTGIRATTDRRTFEIDGPSKKARLYTNGALTKEVATGTATVPSAYPLGLFATVKNADGTYFENLGGKVRLYSLQAYESGTLVLDLQPVLRNGAYLLKDAVTGKTYGPVTGNPFTGGGDITSETGALTWTGAASADWNEAANWQDALGTPCTLPPQAGDAVAIPAGSTVDIGGAAATVKSLTLTGSGTVAFTGANAKTLADSLVIESGVTLSLAAGTTAYVPVATAGGAAVATGRYAGGSQAWLAGDGVLNVNSAGQSVANGVLTLDVPRGQTLAYYTQLTAEITKLVKIGAGTAIISNDSNSAFSGTVEIREGILEAQAGTSGQIQTFGAKKANKITVSDGAQLRVLIPNSSNQGAERFPNELVLAGNGPDGYGALRMVRTTQPVGGSTNIDRLFTTVALAGDASIYSNCRIGFMSGTVDLGGHVLTTRPLEVGNMTVFKMTDCTVTNGSCVAKNVSDVVLSGALNFVGSPANSYTIESGSYFDLWEVIFNKFDWTLILKGGAQMRVGAGTAENRNKIVGPIRLDGGTATLTTYSTTANMRQTLTGVISGTGKLQKSGVHNLYLTNPENSWTGGTGVSGGTLWATQTGTIPPGPISAANPGALNFVAKDWDLGILHNLLTNWNGSGRVNVYTPSGTTLTDDLDFEHAIPYRHGGPGTLTFTAATSPEGKSKIINGEGQMTIGGNKTRYLSQLNVEGGTMTLENAGHIWAGEYDVENNRLTVTNKTWTLGGSNDTAAARMVVKSGTVLDAYVPPNYQASRFYIQDLGTKGAILEVHDGGAVTNWLGIACDTKKRGALYQYGGHVRNTCRSTYDGYLGQNANSYGAFILMDGEFAMRAWWRFGCQPTATGVMRMTGGTFKADTGPVLSCGGWGELYMTGGTSHCGTELYLGEQQWGAAGGTTNTIRGLLTLGGDGNPKMTVTSCIYMAQRTNTFFGAVNLTAGVLSAPWFKKPDWNASLRDNEKSRAYINFGGGTWQAYADKSTIFGPVGQTMNRVTVFPGGATLDINGKSSSNGTVPFEKPFGKGVASIAWPDGTSTNGYIGPPEVYITGGGGTGAVAHCTFDARTGTIGEIVVASPGWAYTSAPTATIMSADRKTTIACTVTLTDGAEQPGGGLTLTNSSETAGTFTLSSANTYTGATVVAGGTLKLGAADAIPAANEVRLAGGTFDAATFSPSYARVGGYGTLKGNVTVTDKLVFDAAQPQQQGLTVNGTLTFGQGVTVEVANTNLLTRGAVYTLATLPTPFPSTPASNLTMPWCVYLTNGGRTLMMHYQSGTMILMR